MAGKRRRAHASQGRSKLDGHEARQLLRIIIWSMGAADILFGVGYLFGAQPSTPSLKAMAMLAPLPLWFGVLVIAGAMLFTERLDSVGFALGGAVITIWLVFTIIAGTWTWPLLGQVAFAHFLGVWITGRLIQRTRLR